MDTVYYTNKGGREVNEDSLFMTDGAYVVCDGLGGHASGEVASNCAVKVLSELCANDPPYNPELINTFYLRANQAVIALSEQALTTIVGGFVRNGILYYQSVGDSRFYYFRNGKKYAQSKDDSVCQAAVDLGSMDYEDIRTSEDRSRLLKVLGNDPALKIMRQYEPVRMQKGDAFLVCSDGFWEHVLDNEMEETLVRSADAEEWLNLMLKIQYSRAGNRDDNYTVICCIVEDTDVGDASAGDGAGPRAEAAVSAPHKAGIIESALSGSAEVQKKDQADEVHTEQLDTEQLDTVQLDTVQDTAEKKPAESMFRRYNDNENVTVSYDDAADEEYYDDGYEDEKPEKKGFFARIFGR